MTLDIRGSLKNTKASSNPYVVFEELLSNALDSFLIRKGSDPSSTDMRVDIEVVFRRTDLLEKKETMSVSCKDNGCGIGDAQQDAFITKDTSYKDDLSIAGIGACKGTGRIQFFHFFSALSIDSIFRSGDELFRRQLQHSEPAKQIDSSSFQTQPVTQGSLGTIIKLDGLKESARARYFPEEQLSNVFSASTLKKQMLVTFLQRLVTLKSTLGSFEINFLTRHWEKDDQQASLKSADLPAATAALEIKVEEKNYSDGTGLGTYQTFKISHYKLDAAQYDLEKNAIALCAKSSPVKDVTSRYLRTRTEQNNAVEGFHHIILIESAYLDLHVNEQRDDFNDIPEDIPSGDLFSRANLSYSGLYEKVDPEITRLVSASDWRKEDVTEKVRNDFGISDAMLQDTSTRIKYGDNAQDVAERVLKKYQERVLADTAEIVNLKDEIKSSEPDSDEFREKINELSWKYTAALKTFDMANLSQLIVRRAAIVQILELACAKKLAMQETSLDKRRKDERIIHSVFFPMRKDSDALSDHDIWLLSEEYQYYDYISSDMALADISWGGSDRLFDNSVDKDLQELLEKRTGENSKKRPDIAIFSKEGSAIIIEFKAPGVSLDEHVGDLAEYAHLLAAKSGGKLKKFYGYLIGDTVNPLRLSAWTPFPTGNGWFHSSPMQDPKTRQLLGETYFEILHYGDVIDRAKKRIGVYQKKLNLNLSDLSLQELSE